MTFNFRKDLAKKNQIVLLHMLLHVDYMFSLWNQIIFKTLFYQLDLNFLLINAFLFLKKTFLRTIKEKKEQKEKNILLKNSFFEICSDCC